ncbi:unnamed protein product [Ectocarpus sp. CCAP 1310/34]|nr:unnamed protein product [Ectocarpus sp. CCAP 1310/34]
MGIGQNRDVPGVQCAKSGRLLNVPRCDDAHTQYRTKSRHSASTRRAQGAPTLSNPFFPAQQPKTV